MRVETLLTAGLVVLALAALAFGALAVRARTTGPGAAGATRARLWFATLARLVLAGYLGVAGLIKLPHPAESVRAVRAYRILPEAIVPTIGYVLPLLEVAIALLLLLGLATRVAAVLSAMLMTAFIIGIASVAARGISIDCGCFGGGGDVAEGATHYTQEIVRDVCLLVLGLLLVWRPASRLSLDPSPLGLDDPDDLDDDLDDDSSDDSDDLADEQDHEASADAAPHLAPPAGTDAGHPTQENRS
jgi:uncharacterized membrane protein YphA (DoxX/SURF4 family)